MNRYHLENARRLGIQLNIESNHIHMVGNLDKSGFSRIFASGGQLQRQTQKLKVDGLVEHKLKEA